MRNRTSTARYGDTPRCIVHVDPNKARYSPFQINRYYYSKSIILLSIHDKGSPFLYIVATWHQTINIFSGFKDNSFIKTNM